MKLDTSKIQTYKTDGIDSRRHSEKSIISKPAKHSVTGFKSFFLRFGKVFFASILSACLAIASFVWDCGPKAVEAFGYSDVIEQSEDSIEQDEKLFLEFDHPIKDKPYIESPSDQKIKIQDIVEPIPESTAATEEPTLVSEPEPESVVSGSTSIPEVVNAEPAPEIIESPQALVTPSSNQFANMTQADFAGKTQQQKIELIGAMARQDMYESGILASITCAQAILESGWMESGLAKRNNLFGIKASKKINAWEGTTWTGSYVEMKTSEEYVEGELTVIKAKFRTYPSVWASIKDHSSYLANCYNGKKKRYEGIVGCRDPRTGIQIIKDGGYATSSTYVDSLMKVVNKYNLTRFDN